MFATNYLLDALKNDVTQFHVVNHLRQFFLENNFTELKIDADWELTPGMAYFVEPFPSMLFAFVYTEHSDMLRICACHTDFPMLKLKPNPIISKKDYTLVNVEPYGGLIKETWFDRPLGLAGKLIAKGDSIFTPKTVLFDSKRPLFTIPNLAPHLKRDSKTDSIDVQKEMLPIMAANESFTNEALQELLTSENELSTEDLLDYDLYLYIAEEPVSIGLHNKLITAPRIDNVSSVSAIATALCDFANASASCNSPEFNCIPVGVFFDNEEIGSRSKQGADSMLLKELLERITPNQGVLHHSFYMSVDVAHATHPNYTEKHDITNDITLGKGVVLKSSASQRYVTDSEASAVFTELCKKNNIAFQKQVNRSGMPGGQTLGPIMASYLPMRAVDIGIPLLAMHSARETMHIDDYLALQQAIGAFYTT